MQSCRLIHQLRPQASSLFTSAPCLSAAWLRWLGRLLGREAAAAPGTVSMGPPPSLRSAAAGRREPPPLHAVVHSHALRRRREMVWEGIVERGVHAEGVGWLLRGYYRDHGRFMNAEELGYFQNVLTCSSGELRMYLGADLIRQQPPVPRWLIQNHVFLQASSQMRQYYRYWKQSDDSEYR